MNQHSLARGLAALTTVVCVHFANAAAPAPDIRVVCPGIDAALQRSLAPDWWRLAGPQTTQVQMRVDGQRIRDVALPGGSYEQRKHLRRALAQLACDSGGAPVDLSFNIHLAD